MHPRKGHPVNVFDFDVVENQPVRRVQSAAAGPANAKPVLRPRTEDLATIGYLMEEHEAPDRTASICSALEHYCAN